MGNTPLRIVILGLTITSSWGNGHATTFRSLMRALVQRGHDVLFLERDKPWYAVHRDMPQPPFGRTELYQTVDDLMEIWGGDIRDADLTIIGSYVPDGIEVGRLVQRLARGIKAFYDIDTPVTLAALDAGTCEYLSPELIPKYDVYLSFTGGPTLEHLMVRWGAQLASALYCSVDADLYAPDSDAVQRYDLGYLGTYSLDRQPTLDELLCEPARAWHAGEFVVAGPLYPTDLLWPENVARIEHLPPALHRRFYAEQRFTLNVTRADMIRQGWSPSVRLFEAASCGTPIITDHWRGLDEFFQPDREIIVVRDRHDVIEALRQISEPDRRALGAAARLRVLGEHTSDHRARELEALTLRAIEHEHRRVSA